MGQKLNSMTFQAWKMKFLKSMTWPVCTLLFGVNLLYYFKISTPEWVSEWGRHLHIKGRYTPGDKLQQHVAVTDHPMCTGRVTSCSNKVRRHVAATNRFVCTGEFLWKSLSPQQNFVAATSRKKSNQTESVRLVVATKFCCSDKVFTKFSTTHKLICRCNVSPQRVAATCRLVCTDLKVFTKTGSFPRQS